MPNSSISAILPYWDESNLTTVCGIANAGGGTIVVQSMDHKGFRERSRFRKLFETIPYICMRELGLSCPVEPIMEGSELCLEISVPRAESPVSYQGKYYLYANGTDQLITVEELERLHERNDDVSWEGRLQAFVREEDFDSDMVDVLEQVLKDELGTHPSQDEVRNALHEFGLKNKQTDSFTNVGVLLLHKAPHRYIPGAEVHIDVFDADGTQRLASETIAGPLTKQMRHTLESLYDHLLPELTGVASDVRDGPGSELPPFEATQEALLNALIHKDYESTLPVRISVYPDRLYVDNVGRPPESWTLTDLLGRHNSRPRNPMLARSLKRRNIFNGWGGGIGTMISLCTRVGLPAPEFSLRADELGVCLYFRTQEADSDVVLDGSGVLSASTSQPANQASAQTAQAQAKPNAAPTPTPRRRKSDMIEDHRIRIETSEAQGRKQTFKERSIAAANRLDMTSTDEYVLKVIETNGRVTAMRIADVLGVSESTVRRSFKRLREYGFIERIGSDKSGYWRLVD